MKVYREEHHTFYEPHIPTIVRGYFLCDEEASCGTPGSLQSLVQFEDEEHQDEFEELVDSLFPQLCPSDPLKRQAYICGLLAAKDDGFDFDRLIRKEFPEWDSVYENIYHDNFDKLTELLHR